MTNNIEVDLAAVGLAINRIRARSVSEAHTSDIIREYMGGFLSNKGVGAHLSWNAQFGKILAANANLLGIEEISADQSVVDDLGHKTTSSKWRL